MRHEKQLVCAAITCLAPIGIAGAQYTLAWSDEFDGNEIDASVWEHQIGTGTQYGLPAGWGNNEHQYYTDRPENSFVADGSLHIVTLAENFGGRSYTSARLRSVNGPSFRYGRIEARMKLPSTKGIWPAFWMLPTNSAYGGWAASGEIDVMESVNEADRVYGTIHYGGNWPANASAGGTRTGEDYGADFHVYAIEWEPEMIRWYLDGVLYYIRGNNQWYSDDAPENAFAPFDEEFHLLLNTAIGGNFPGPPDGTTELPQEFVIDYVRVYTNEQAAYPAGVPHAVPGLIEAEDYDTGGPGIAYQDCNAANEGGAYRPDDAVDIEASSEAGFNVGWLCSGEWLEYTLEVPEAAEYTIDVRVASQSTGGVFHLEFAGVDATGPAAVPITGGWQQWQTVRLTADLQAGVQVMRFVNDSPAVQEYNINFFDLSIITCAADWSGNGVVNSEDFFTFLTDFFGSDADVNGDGATNSLDLFDFLAAFSAGC